MMLRKLLSKPSPWLIEVAQGQGSDFIAYCPMKFRPWGGTVIVCLN